VDQRDGSPSRQAQRSEFVGITAGDSLAGLQNIGIPGLSEAQSVDGGPPGQALPAIAVAVTVIDEEHRALAGLTDTLPGRRGMIDALNLIAGPLDNACDLLSFSDVLTRQAIRGRVYRSDNDKRKRRNNAFQRRLSLSESRCETRAYADDGKHDRKMSAWTNQRRPQVGCLITHILYSMFRRENAGKQEDGDSWSEMAMLLTTGPAQQFVAPASRPRYWQARGPART
jgi:hypothetical protein